MRPYQFCDGREVAVAVCLWASAIPKQVLHKKLLPLSPPTPFALECKHNRFNPTHQVFILLCVRNASTLALAFPCFVTLLLQHEEQTVLSWSVCNSFSLFRGNAAAARRANRFWVVCNSFSFFRDIAAAARGANHVWSYATAFLCFVTLLLQHGEPHLRQSPAGLVPVSCRPRANLVKASCQSCESLAQASCKPRASLVPIS